MVTTIAGTGKPGFVNGNALTEARFHDPTCLVVREDVIYVCDSDNGAIRKIENGMVSTLASGLCCRGIALDTNGDILVTDYVEDSILSIDSKNGSIRRFPKLSMTCYKVAVSSDGIIYVSSYVGSIAYWSGEDWKVIARTDVQIGDFVLDSFGNLLFVELEWRRIRKMDLSNGNVRLFAGSEEGNSDGPVLESRFRGPYGIAMDRSSIYISDCLDHTIRKINILGLWSKGKTGATRFPTFVQKIIPSFPRR